MFLLQDRNPRGADRVEQIALLVLLRGRCVSPTDGLNRAPVRVCTPASLQDGSLRPWRARTCLAEQNLSRGRIAAEVCGTADKVRGNCRFSVSFSAEFQGKQRNRESPENRLSYCAASPPPEACENEKLILYTPPERGRRCDADGAPRGVERSRKKTLVTPSTWIGMTRTSRRTRSSPCGPRNWSLAQFAYEIRSLQDSFSMITRFDLSTYQR